MEVVKVVVLPETTPESNTSEPASVARLKSVIDNNPPSSLMICLTITISAFGTTGTVLLLFVVSVSN